MIYAYSVKIQKLFAVTLALKVLSSTAGWLFNSPWVLGFIFPLLFMAMYIAIGLRRHDSDLTDEKFADTCYYLGFIFTITSIIFGLFDLPNIGTKIQDIAVRFGAAMVSTVLGLCVRVYLVSFKKDIGDAIKDAEDAVLDATRKFTEQLTIALEKLHDFESQVDDAAKSSVERVNLQVESLSKNHADKLAEFFSDLTVRNQDAFVNALAEVKTASQRLSDSVDGYSNGMMANLGSIEAKVGAFTEAVVDRLKTTTFPDDFFAKHMQSPLDQLKESADRLAGGVVSATAAVDESTVVLSDALGKLRDKAGVAESSLDTVVKLAAQQLATFEATQGQLLALDKVSSNLSGLDEVLGKTIDSINATNAVTAELNASVCSVVVEGAAARVSLEGSLAVVVSKLNSNTEAVSAIASKLEDNVNATIAAAATVSERLDVNSMAAKEASSSIFESLQTGKVALGSVVGGLDAATLASEALAAKIDSVAETDRQALGAINSLGEQVVAVVRHVDSAVAQLQSAVLHFSNVDAAMVGQRQDLNSLVSQVQGLKSLVDDSRIVEYQSITDGNGGVVALSANAPVPNI